MSIKQQIEDAKFLAAHGRNLGALTVLMLAIAATSRKMFPRPTPSIENPGKEMGDAEAFKLFLGGQIAKSFGLMNAPEAGTSGVNLQFRGKQHLIEHILYKFYRCELIHEGELPKDVEFTDIDGKSNSFSFGVSEDNIVLDSGWINVLINSVVRARVNGPEFGIAHYDLVPKNADEESFMSSILKKHGITHGRFVILKHVVRALSPASIAASSDESLKHNFQRLVDAEVVNGGMLTGLRSAGLLDQRNAMLDTGVRALRDISAGYEMVQVG